MVSQECAAAGCCGVPYEAVTAVTSPPHHAVDMTPSLGRYGAVEGGVWGGAVQGCRERDENRKKLKKPNCNLYEKI